MTAEDSQVVRGYVSDLSIRKVFDQGVARFDVELSLSREWREGSNKTVIRFTDARNVRYGDLREGIDFGAHMSLAIEDVSNNGWCRTRWQRLPFRRRICRRGCWLVARPQIAI